jgi:hypothetical protein
MSASQNLAYATAQIVHNFGAVAVVGGSLAALRFKDADTRKFLAKVVLAGWTVQALSGASLGGISLYFYHQLPDIAGIALAALLVKMGCAAVGLLLMTAYLMQSRVWTEDGINRFWQFASGLAMLAISAAAFLRWFA